jgi:dihydrofolate reductase
VAKTQYYTATSIDGFIADAGNSLDWLFQVGSGSEPANDRFGTFMAGVGAMAMGATTYEWVLNHEGSLEDPSAWQKYYGATPC